MTDTASVPVTPSPAPAAAPVPKHAAVMAPVPGSRPGFPTTRAAPGAGSGPQRVIVTGEAPAAEATSERPAWLPEKFKSPEDLAQAYQALERHMSTGTSPAPAPVLGIPAQAPVAGAESVALTPAAPANAGDLVQRMTQEWAASGQVTTAMRQEFTQRTGLPETFIDQQIAYLQGQNTRMHELAVERLGGADAVGELTEWAKGRLPEADRETFNRAVYSGDQRLAQLALDGLAARYELENGRSPRLIAGRRPSPHKGGLVAFQSNEEWSVARKDPRYKSDPAYRDEVARRMQMGLELGTL